MIRRLIATGFYYQAGEKLDYLLPPFTILDLTDCIIMEIIKLLFEKAMPKTSLRSHLLENGLTDDASKMRFSRLLNYAQHYRTAQSDVIVSEGGATPAELLPDNVSSMPDRLRGHQLTAMQFFELRMVDRLPLLKVIARGRISSVEKVSHKTLRELLDEYADAVEELKATAAVDERSYVFNALALYRLEWKYCIDFAYTAICASETTSGSDPFDAAKFLVGRATIHKGRTAIPTDNRFVLHRKSLIPKALQKNSEAEIGRKIGAYLSLKDEAICGMTGRKFLIGFLRKETTLVDWAEFMKKHYPILENHITYDWTNERLRSFRKLMGQIFVELPPPPSSPKKEKTSK